MKRWICVLLVLPYYAFTQNWTNQFTIPTHVSAYQKNQSPIIGLADLPGLMGFERIKEIGALIENKYSLSSLSRLFLAAGLPLGTGNVSLHSSFQGAMLYSHFTGHINYGLPLNKLSSIGISIGITHFKLKDDVPDLFLHAIAGIAHQINDKTLLAIHYQHNRKLGSTMLSKRFIPNGIRVGLGYQVSRPVFIQLEIRKEDQLQVLPAINWRPHAKIEFWCGLNGGGQLAVGVLGHAKSMSTGIALSNHPHLGYSMQLQLNKRFHEKK